MKKSLLPMLLLAALAIASCSKKTDTAMTDSTKAADSTMHAPAAPTAMAPHNDTINRHPANPPTGGKIGPPQKPHLKVSGVPGSLSITAPPNTTSLINLNTKNGMLPDSVWVTATFSGPDAGELNISSLAWNGFGWGCQTIQSNSCSIEVAMNAPGNSNAVTVNAFLQTSGWSNVTNNPPGTQANNSGMGVTTYTWGPDTCVVTIWDTGIPVQQQQPGGGPNAMVKKK